MKIIKLTQGFETLVSDEDCDYLNQWKWGVTRSKSQVYAWRDITILGRRTHARMHNEIGKRLGLIGRVDHIDRNGLNNQRYNLRRATVSENNINKEIRADNTSGFKGVTWSSRKLKWRVRIGHHNSKIELGYFDNIIEAAIVYNEAAIRYHKNFAVLNIIPQIISINPDSFALKPFED